MRIGRRETAKAIYEYQNIIKIIRETDENTFKNIQMKNMKIDSRNNNMNKV